MAYQIEYHWDGNDIGKIMLYKMRKLNSPGMLVNSVIKACAITKAERRYEEHLSVVGGVHD